MVTQQEIHDGLNVVKLVKKYPTISLDVVSTVVATWSGDVEAIAGVLDVMADQVAS